MGPIGPTRRSDIHSADKVAKVENFVMRYDDDTLQKFDAPAAGWCARLRAESKVQGYDQVAESKWRYSYDILHIKELYAVRCKPT
jgi:hypothetical protein